jgi:hypothetical protein
MDTGTSLCDCDFILKIQPDSGTVDLKQVYQKFQLREYFTKLSACAYARHPSID